jgi:hypothetical protein
MRPALVAFAVFAAGAAWAQDDFADRAAVTAKVGREPYYCAHTLADRQLCTWSDGGADHLVCEFDAAGKRTATPCLRRPDNEQMWSFPAATNGPRTTAKSNTRAQLRAEAQAQLDATRSLEQMVSFVGAGPVWCHADGAALTCSWHVVRRTPGYIEISRIANEPGKKANLHCVFAADGASRADGSCTTSIGGRAEPPPT